MLMLAVPTLPLRLGISRGYNNVAIRGYRTFVQRAHGKRLSPVAYHQRFTSQSPEFKIPPSSETGVDKPAGVEAPVNSEVEKKHIIPMYDVDKVPRDCHIIYSRRIYLTGLKQIFAISLAAFIVLSCSTFWCYSEAEDVLIPVIDIEVPDIVLGYVCLVFLLAVNAAFTIYRRNKLSVIRMYQTPKPDRYIAVITDGLRKQKKVEFGLAELIPTNTTTKVRNGNALIGDRIVALWLDDFINDSCYNKLFKLEDRPINVRRQTTPIPRDQTRP